MKNLLIASTLAMGAISFGAQAATADQIGKPYAFVGANYALDVDAEGTSGLSQSTESLGINLIGGYRLNDNLAIEGGYRDLGTVRLTGPGGFIELEASGFSLGVTGIAPVTVGVEVYAGAGLYSWDADVFTNVGGGMTSSGSGNDLYFKVGAAFNATDTTMLHLEYGTQDLKDDGDVTVDQLTFGASFSF